jgi:hypothetical protein
MLTVSTTTAGRGIQFLFTSFPEFYAEIGPRPKTLSRSVCVLSSRY